MKHTYNRSHSVINICGAQIIPLLIISSLLYIKNIINSIKYNIQSDNGLHHQLSRYLVIWREQKGVLYPPHDNHMSTEWCLKHIVGRYVQLICCSSFLTGHALHYLIWYRYKIQDCISVSICQWHNQLYEMHVEHYFIFLPQIV